MQIIPAGYLHFSSFFAIIHKVNSCARSEVGLSRLPVTEEIAGSNPVGRAKIKHSPFGGYFILVRLVQIQAYRKSDLTNNIRPDFNSAL